MLRTAALASLLLAGSLVTAEDTKPAGQEAAKSTALEGAKKTTPDEAKKTTPDETKKAADDEAKKAADDEAKKAAFDAVKKAAGEAAKKATEEPKKSASLRGGVRGTWTKAPTDAGGHSATGWQFFRFTPKITRDPEADAVQLMEIYFYAGAQRIPALGVSATDPMGTMPAGEDAPKAVDGNIQTKWLDFQKQYLVIAWQTPQLPTAWSYVTGDDSEDRDPVDFTMEASADQQSWQLVTDVTGYLGNVARSSESQQFTISTSDPTGGNDGSSDGGCGGGCAFLIIFFVGGFVYFAAGFAFNYKQRELRGAEAIPQVAFWKDLPFLVKDGVQFTVGKIQGRSAYTAV